MANPYYNAGTNHTDYSQGHAMPQSPFQQSHPNTTPTAAAQHLPVYQHSPYTVHSLPPQTHPTYAAAGDHPVLQYNPTIHHPHGNRWVDSLDAEESLLSKYRSDDPEPDYEIDPQSQDHQQQQSLQPLQGTTASHESQTHANMQQHPPITTGSTQPEQMSPAIRPGGIRTGRRGRPPGSKNKIPARRKSPSDQKLEEPDDDLIDDTGPGIKTKYGRKVHAPQQFQPTQGTSRKRRQPDETHFCQICTRSMSPANNRLVFCDNCDTPYHQHCHSPPVSDETVTSNNKWFCSSCKPPTGIEEFSTRMTGQGMTPGQKRALLQALNRTQLEDTIIFASDMYPTLPLFPAGDVDQFQVPRIHPTPRQPGIPDMDINDHSQYNHARLQDQELQQTLPMTPMHDVQPQQSPLDSPIYGQNTDLPHYELMIVHALTAINDPSGSPPKAIWDWMNNNYPCNPKFRASASQALQKALKKGRLLKNGSLYKINPEFNPATAENPKATRKPQVGRMHPLFNQMHSRNNSIQTLSSPMQNPHPQQQPQHPQAQPPPPQQIPPTDIPPLNMPGPLPSLNPRDHDPAPAPASAYIDHNAVFGATLADPAAHSYADPVPRPASSHDAAHVLPSYTHHPHSL